MSKEEIRHFKSLLRQGSLRHMNILLDDKFQSELLNIIKDYELLEKENKQLKDNWNKLKEYIGTEWYCFNNESVEFEVAKSILSKMQELEKGSDSDEQK